MTTEVKNIKDAIRKNDLDKAFFLLQEIASKAAFSGFSNLVIIQKANYEDLQENSIKGVLSGPEVELKRNKIIANVLEIVDSIEVHFKKNLDSSSGVLSSNFTRSHLKHVIDGEKKEKKIYFTYTVFIIVIGIATAAYGFIVHEQPTVKSVFSAGAFLLSSISGFPIREIIKRNRSIGVWEMFLAELNTYDAEKVKDENYTRIQSLIWKKMEDITMS